MFGEIEVYEVNGPDIKAVNDFDVTNVKTVSKPGIKVKGESFTYTFPAHSFTMLKGKVKLP